MSVCVRRWQRKSCQDCIVHGWLEFIFLLWGAGPDHPMREGAGFQKGAALLIPQDGVLVVELQLLLSSSAAFFSAAGFVLHHLKGLL